MVNSDDSYLSVPLPLPAQQKEASIASYEQHNQRVREVIPSHLLLEYNVKDGWEPLCSFLELNNEEECPTNVPFPKSNSARSMQAQGISSFAFPIAVVCFLVFYAFAMGFQRMTGGMTVVGWLHWKMTNVVHCVFKGAGVVRVVPSSSSSSSSRRRVKKGRNHQRPMISSRQQERKEV
mmetsp:Transcript_8534/g.12471  ORF Transcript_8534/g.12471 Transcript_8534/m.12471 type:complete len:178 (-) Transcript_8534:356-889(-)